MTKDVDVALGIAPADAERLLGLLPAAAFVPLVDDAKKFLKETFVLPVIDSQSELRIDFIFSLSDYERGAIDRARNVLVGERTIRFISPEDLLVHKLLAARPRDIDDREYSAEESWARSAACPGMAG